MEKVEKEEKNMFTGVKTHTLSSWTHLLITVHSLPHTVSPQSCLSFPFLFFSFLCFLFGVGCCHCLSAIHVQACVFFVLLDGSHFESAKTVFPRHLICPALVPLCLVLPFYPVVGSQVLESPLLSPPANKKNSHRVLLIRSQFCLLCRFLAQSTS